MSVVFIVAPAVVASWPILCGVIAAAAGTLGFKALNTGQRIDARQSAEAFVEIPLEASEVVADAMKRESAFVIANDEVVATFKRAADGRCIVHVSGKDKTEQELTAAGRQILGRVTQQYAYNKVLTELKSQGFTVTNEEVANDQTIRIRVSKYV